jgi:hypothetical protein
MRTIRGNLHEVRAHNLIALNQHAPILRDTYNRVSAAMVAAAAAQERLLERESRMQSDVNSEKSYSEGHPVIVYKLLNV